MVGFNVQKYPINIIMLVSEFLQGFFYFKLNILRLLLSGMGTETAKGTILIVSKFQKFLMSTEKNNVIEIRHKNFV